MLYIYPCIPSCYCCISQNKRILDKNVGSDKMLPAMSVKKIQIDSVATYQARISPQEWFPVLEPADTHRRSSSRWTPEGDLAIHQAILPSTRALRLPRRGCRKHRQQSQMADPRSLGRTCDHITHFFIITHIQYAVMAYLDGIFGAGSCNGKEL